MCQIYKILELYIGGAGNLISFFISCTCQECIDEMFYNEYNVDVFDVKNADIYYIKNFIKHPEVLFMYLYEEIPFDQDQSFVHGKLHDQPRLTCLMGESSYYYSGKMRAPVPMTRWGEIVRFKVYDIVKQMYTDHPAFVRNIANLYRNGNDYIAHHYDKSDDKYCIPSVSLGAERDFIMSERNGTVKGKRVIEQKLASGSLFIMGPGTQTNYFHEVPKRLRIKEPRINLTFRV